MAKLILVILLIATFLGCGEEKENQIVVSPSQTRTSWKVTLDLLPEMLLPVLDREPDNPTVEITLNKGPFSDKYKYQVEVWGVIGNVVHVGICDLKITSLQLFADDNLSEEILSKIMSENMPRQILRGEYKEFSFKTIMTDKPLRKLHVIFAVDFRPCR